MRVLKTKNSRSIDGHAFGLLRIPCRAPRGHWALWSYVLHGDPADQRNWNPYGDWSGALRRPENDSSRSDCAHGHRLGDWSRPRAGRSAILQVIALRLNASRPAHSG